MGGGAAQRTPPALVALATVVAAFGWMAGGWRLLPPDPETLAVRAAYRRIAAEKGVAYVDLFHERADDPFRGEHSFYGRDLLHLSEAGYGVWYADVRSTMRAAGIAL